MCRCLLAMYSLKRWQTLSTSLKTWTTMHRSPWNVSSGSVLQHGMGSGTARPRIYSDEYRSA